MTMKQKRRLLYCWEVPVTNSAPMDCSVRIPYTISTILGGMIMPKPPPDATAPVRTWHIDIA